MKTPIIILCSAAQLLCYQNAFSQGCSDAGFCTAGAINPSAQHDSAHHRIGISFTTGIGEKHTTIYTPQLELNLELAKHYSLEVKLPFNIASGKLGTIAGIGDPIITASGNWNLHKNWRIHATAGTRISVTEANAKDNKGRALPMPYQRGLGTTDLIAGVSCSYKKWAFISAGYQQPLIQYNHNGYVSNTTGDADYDIYFSSRKLERRGDVLLRAEGSFGVRKWNIAAGPLFIWHLGEDSYTLPGNNTMHIANSSGLTLNGTARISYDAAKTYWELSGGTPFIVRENRPDGLTREWILTLRCAYKYATKRSLSGNGQSGEYH